MTPGLVAAGGASVPGAPGTTADSTAADPLPGLTLDDAVLAAASMPLAGLDPGLAAFYRGLEEVLGKDAVARALNGPDSQLWLLDESRQSGSVTPDALLASGLVLLAFLLTASLLPRVAAAGYLPDSALTRHLARESFFLTVMAIALTVLLAALAVHAAL